MSIHISDEIYFCPHSFEVFVSCQDKHKFRYEYEYPYVYYEFENKVLSFCLSCYLKVDSCVQKSSKWFIRYFTEEQKKMIEALESIVINYLFKNCNQDEKFEKKKIINRLFTVSLMKFNLFQVQKIFGFANVQCTITSLT